MQNRANGHIENDEAKAIARKQKKSEYNRRHFEKCETAKGKQEKPQKYHSGTLYNAIDILASRGRDHLTTKAFRLLARNEFGLGITEQHLEDIVFMNNVRQRIAYKIGMINGVKRQRKPKDVSLYYS